MSRNPDIGGCPSHKLGFRSRAKARRFLLSGHNAQSPARSVYECNLCGLWHISKQRPRHPLTKKSRAA